MKLAHGLSIDSLAEPSQGTTAFASWYAPGLSDELGDRLLMFDNSSAPSLELLRFRPSLIATPGFEVALRRRVERLRHFRHPAFANVRAVEYLGSGNGLALLSNHTPGKRLSEILHDARGPAFAAVLIQQLTPALASLQQYGEGGGHGALAASRIVVTPEGRLMIVEHVLGPALERLQLSADRLRGELGIALPPAASHYRLDSRTDYFQLGLIALSLLLGRRLGPNESREDIARLLEQVARTADRDSPILFASLRGWLERALQVNDQVFESAGDAEDALLELAGAGSVRQALPTSPIPEAALQGPSVTSVAAPDEPAPLVLDVPSDIPSEPLALEQPAEADAVASPTMPADAPEPATEALEVFLHRDPVEFLTEPIAAELEKPVPTLEFEPVVSVPPAASDAIPDLSPPTAWPVLPQEAEGPSQVAPIDARAAQAHEPPRPMLEELQPRERERDPAPDSPSQPSPIAPLPTRPRKARLLKTKTKGREEIMRALVSALAMCVVGEAFVIAGLILSRGAGAPAAVLVETAAPGADVLVDGRA
jgi:hypothetical protein